MSSARWIRGSALPETALVMTAVLGMVLGIIQIGFIGLLQVMSDGAAFIAAHEYSLSNASYATVAAKPFPLMGTPIATPNPPDVASSTIPVTYGGEASTAREGGVSILMPNHSQATVNIASSTLLGSGLGALWQINLHGSAIEPNYLVSNSAYDIAGAGYTGNAAGTTFFGSKEDTPYYYVSLHRILICTASFYLPTDPKWTTCPQFGIRTFGTAEFLDVDNWGRSGGVGPGTASYTFAEIYCHVNAYVQFASTLFVYKTTAAAMPAYGAGTSATAHIYDWDGNGGASYHTNVSTTGTHPLYPNANCEPFSF